MNQEIFRKLNRLIINLPLEPYYRFLVHFKPNRTLYCTILCLFKHLLSNIFY